MRRLTAAPIFLQSSAKSLASVRMFCYNAVSFVKLCRPIGRRNGVLYESKTYDVSGNVHDHCPDDFCGGGNAAAARPDPRDQAGTCQCRYAVASVLCYLEGCSVRTSDAYPDRQHGDRTDGILLLQPVRRSVLFRGHGTALSAAREKTHPFYQCDRCPFP